jgi:hypothetical protein
VSSTYFKIAMPLGIKGSIKPVTLSLYWALTTILAKTSATKLKKRGDKGVTLPDPLIALKIGTQLVIHSNNYNPIMQNLFKPGAPGIIETSGFKALN